VLSVKTARSSSVQRNEKKPRNTIISRMKNQRKNEQPKWYINDSMVASMRKELFRVCSGMRKSKQNQRLAEVCTTMYFFFGRIRRRGNAV